MKGQIGLAQCAGAAILCVALGGCQTKRESVQPTGGNLFSLDLAYVEKADPVRDAKAAFEAKDYRFVAVNGYTRFVPHIDDAHVELRNRIQLKVIDGTSDAYRSDWESRTNAIARVYAERYNKALYEQLDAAKLLP